MSSAIAILSYRRGHALRAFMVSLREHCTGRPLAVFEDCGNADDTCAWLKQSAKLVGPDQELAAELWEGFDYEAYLGWRNLGVSGNSNRALRWFERHPEHDHLCLCNDDLIALGDFPGAYAKAHAKLSQPPATPLGLFCFSDLKNGQGGPDRIYEGPVVTVKGLKIKIKFTQVFGLELIYFQLYHNKTAQLPVKE